MQINNNSIPVYFTHTQNWVILRAFQYACCSASNLMTQLIHVFGAGISQLNTSKNFKKFIFLYFS